MCISLPHVEESTPFAEIGSDAIVFKVSGKMFGLLRTDVSRMIALKCDPEYAIELRERYPSVIDPAYHFNKKYWNQIHYEAPQINEDLLTKLINHAFDETVKKLTKKLRQELGL